MSDDQIWKLLEKINEIHSDVSVIKSEVHNIKQNVSKNTHDLADHIQGVRTNTSRLDMERKYRMDLENEVHSIDIRVEKIESFPKTLSFIGKSLAWIGGVSAAILTSIKLLEMLGFRIF